MSEVINLDDHRKVPQEPPEKSRKEVIEAMMLTLESQYTTLKEMLENDTDYLEVTVAGGSPMRFFPTSLGVVMGNGSVVLTSGLSSLNSIEALALKQKMTEIVFGE